MKKLYIIFTFMFTTALQANQKTIQTPFWSATYNDQPEIAMYPLQNGLAEDCQSYSGFLAEQAQNISSEDLQFARTLPLAGQMKNSYEAEFRLNDSFTTGKTSESKKFFDYKISKPSIEINHSTLTNLGVESKAVSFSQISKRLGLPDAKIELFKNIIRINSRDLACDLIAGHLKLTANAELQIRLNAEDQNVLDSFYTPLSQKTAEILAGNQNDYVKAAQLGIMFSEFFSSYSIEKEDFKIYVEFLFSNLFKTGSLEKNQNWVGDIINYHKTRFLGFSPVTLKAVIL